MGTTPHPSQKTGLLTERDMHRHVMVTIGLKNVNLPHKDATGASPVMIVHYNDDSNSVLERLSWGSPDLKNMVIGLEDSLIVVPIPVDKEVYNAFLKAAGASSPAYDILKWVWESKKQPYTMVPYYESKK